MGDRKPSVLFVSGSLAGGGAERVTSTLLQHLDREKFAPSLCLLREKISYPIPGDVDVTFVHQGELYDRPLAELMKRRPWLLSGTIKKLRQQIIAHAPDVILSNIDQVNCVTGTTLRKIKDRPKWIARLGSNPQRQPTLAKWWGKWIYARADHIVANSQRLAADFGRAYGLPKERISAIANLTDFEAIDRLAAETPMVRRESSNPLIVTAGRLSSPKRFDILIDAVVQIRRTIPVEVWICGEGPLRPQLERQLRNNGLEGVVRLLGFCENPHAILRQADLFVMTSDHEGLPNALIEAQGLGIPAVATDCEYGPSEIILPNKTGLLVRIRDAEGLCKSITSLLQAKDLLLKMGSQARDATRKRFGLGQLLSDWESAIAQV